MRDEDKKVIGSPRNTSGEVVWSIHHETKGSGTVGPALTWDDGSGVVVGDWPLEECTLDNIEDRWGHGQFRVRFWTIDGEGRRVTAGCGKYFALQEPTPAPAPPAPRPREVAQAQAPAELGTALSLLQLLKEERRGGQRDQLESMGALAQLMGALGGNRGAAGGVDSQYVEQQLSLFKRELVFAMSQELDALNKRTEAALQAMKTELLATLDARLEEFEGDDEEEDEEEDEDEREPPRERPESIGDALKTNAIDGVDSVLREAIPMVGPAVGAYVTALGEKAQAEATLAKERLERERLGMLPVLPPNVAPPPAPSPDKGAHAAAE